MKFAVLITYELRAIKKTIEKYYKYLIDYYNADVFIICQKQFEDDLDRLKLFTHNVKFIQMYDKPIPHEYFGKNSNIDCLKDNCALPSNLQVYINHNEVSKILEHYYNDYDYFIHLRIDIDILFNFPEIEFFNKIPKGIYSFLPQYCQGWGGSGGGNFIHKDFVIKYFKSYYNLISDEKNRDLILNMGSKYIHLNQENFLDYSLKIQNLKMIPIRNINYYYTAETLNDYTTWSSPKLYSKYNVICKYPEQCDEAYQAANLWYKGYRWNYINGEIMLVI